MLKIYNTLARDKQEFKPIEPNKVRMYVCGMTVYDYCHLGHARVMVVFDMVYRWLKTSGYDVTYVRNITDIDDKIIKRAAEENKRAAEGEKRTIHALTQRFIDFMHEDERALGILPPTHEPRATQYIPQMLEMIAQLEKNGLAYRAADGDVNFAVRKFAGYGKLSGKSLEDLRAGERVEVASEKHDPLDFVLWKSAKDSEPDEVKWDSRWGKGRPGWHIECSAMGSELLGKHFDIHGGGADLQFPHHENEIAQSEGAHQCQYVNYWMHNGFVRVDNEKMSKSLGNFFTIRDVLGRLTKEYHGDREKAAEVVRFFILRAHYRSPLNYSDAHLDDANGALTSLYKALEGVQATVPPVDWNEGGYVFRFKAAMDDDFNTPEAMAVLFHLVNEINKHKHLSQKADFSSHISHLQSQLKALAGVLGLLQRNPEDFAKGRVTGQINITTAFTVDMTGAQSHAPESVSHLIEAGGGEDQINAQIAARIAAKKAKNYAEADRIRKELLDAGIVLEDTPQGTTWRRA